MVEATTTAAFKFAENMIPRLVKELLKRTGARKKELESITGTFGDPMKWAAYYVEPYCQQFNPADDYDEVRHVVRESLTSRLQHFISGAENISSSHLLILADSGMGKTSCLVMLKLAHLRSFWPSSYSVHLLKLGPETLNQVKALEKRKTILLLDALDEDPMARGRVPERLTEILNATKHFTRVVITCRTQFFSGGADPFNRRGQVEVGGFLCPVVYLSLFDDYQVEEYLLKRFPGDANAVKRATTILGKMRALKFRPMLLSRIDDLLESSDFEDDDWTTFTVYESLVAAWLHRERTKMLAQRPPEEVPNIDDLLHACMMLARLMFQLGDVTVSPDAIANSIAFLPDLQHLEAIDIAGRSLLNKNSDGNFRFAHFSVQEYLFSLVVFRGLIRVSKRREFKPTSLVFAFLDHLIRPLDSEHRARLKLDNLDLAGLQFRDLDQTHLNFAAQIFEQTSWIDCTLQGANLRGARLVTSTLRTSILAGVDLSEARIIDSKFEKCNITDALLSRARFERSTFADCLFSGTRLNEATFDNCLLLSPLPKVELAGAQFNSCQFSEQFFSKADWVDGLKNLCFSQCDFEGSLFLGMELRQVRFTSCRFTNQALRDVKLLECDFQECDLHMSGLNKRQSDGNSFVKCVVPERWKEEPTPAPES